MIIYEFHMPDLIGETKFRGNYEIKMKDTFGELLISGNDSRMPAIIASAKSHPIMCTSYTTPVCISSSDIYVLA